jgi:hypothetical protein
MNIPDIIFRSVPVVGSIVVSVGMFLSRRRIYDTWAKVASVLLCVFGLVWAVIGFILPHFTASTSWPAHIALVMSRSFLCGVCVGLLISIIIARPYKKVTDEKSKPLV